LRGGVKTVLIPEDNAGGLVEIADSIKSGLEIVRARPRDDTQAGASRMGRDRDHRSGHARGGPGRGASLDAHRALNDCDTGAAAVVTSQNFIHSSKLGDSSWMKPWRGQSRRSRTVNEPKARMIPGTVQEALAEVFTTAKIERIARLINEPSGSMFGFYDC